MQCIMEVFAIADKAKANRKMNVVWEGALLILAIQKVAVRRNIELFLQICRGDWQRSRSRGTRRWKTKQCYDILHCIWIQMWDNYSSILLNHIAVQGYKHTRGIFLCFIMLHNYTVSPRSNSAVNYILHHFIIIIYYISYHATYLMSVKGILVNLKTRGKRRYIFTTCFLWL